ncbi:MAG TPA: hypothetical protein VF796_23255, partial [Humisphaera sp.]
SPRGALKWLAAALRDGDADRVAAVLLPVGDAEARMVAAMADQARALNALYRVTAAAYGADAAGRFADDATAQFDATAAKIDAADLTVSGDTATVRYAEAKDRPYTLARVRGHWRVPVAQFTGGQPAAAVDQAVAEMRVMTRVIDAFAAEVAAGRHKSADAAGLAWRGKMMSALGEARPGTATGPATGPASRPVTAPTSLPATAPSTSPATRP